MNAMSDALKQRRMGSVPPKPQGGMSPEGGAKVQLEDLVANLDKDTSMKLMTLLQTKMQSEENAEHEEGESAEHEGAEEGETVNDTRPDINGPSAVTSGELEEANSKVGQDDIEEARNIFKGQENALGTPDPEGQKVRGLGDRMKNAVNKYLKK